VTEWNGRYKTYLRGVRFRREGEALDLERVIGRNLGALIPPSSVLAAAPSTPATSAAAADSEAVARTEGGDLTRKADEEVDTDESPEAKRRRRDSGFHEMAAEGELLFASTTLSAR